MFAASPATATLLVELGAILIGLAILGRLASRVGIPAVPLYLVAGLLVGEGGLVELVTARDFIESASQIGVILLLLLLGLEYSGTELMGALRANSTSGLIDLVLNFTPGAATGALLGWGTNGALLLGGITYISSSGIIARVLDDLGNTGNRETPVVLSILVIEDLVMALYLPLMAGLLIGGDPGAIAIEIAVAVAAVILTLFAAVRFGPRIERVAVHAVPGGTPPDTRRCGAGGRRRRRAGARIRCSRSLPRRRRAQRTSGTDSPPTPHATA